jgi:hypothetical protein
MVRFLRRRICGQGRALTFVGVAETFVALNRGPRVEPMDIGQGSGCRVEVKDGANGWRVGATGAFRVLSRPFFSRPRDC